MTAPPEPTKDKSKRRRSDVDEITVDPLLLPLPDTSAVFRAEARRQSLLVAQSPGEADDQAFVDSLWEFDDWVWEH